MSDAKLPQTGSSAWQAEYLRDHASEQTQYLESVAASDVVQQVALRAMDLLSLQAGQRVLELGCGSGVFLPRLAGAVGATGMVVGLDHSADLIAAAKARVAEARLDPWVRLEQGDAYALPFETNAFDAAHCERVLMHLEDPNAALAELRRVVRPGGIIVAAEPDWMGVRIDHPDREVFDQVFGRALKHRHGDMGLTLFRRFSELGLVNRRYAMVSAVVEDFQTWKMFGLDLEPAVEKLAREGQFEAGRLASTVRILEEASAAGCFYSTATVHIASGTVPAG